MNETVRRLIEGLRAEDAAVRCRAAEELAALGEEARPAAVALACAAGDEVEEVREAAAGCLEELGPPLPEQVSELAGLLAEGGADPAYWAATLIGRLESGGAPAVPALAQALQAGRELPVRQRAAWALGRIGPPLSVAEEALQQAARDADARLARLAQEALGNLRG